MGGAVAIGGGEVGSEVPGQNVVLRIAGYPVPVLAVFRGMELE